MKARMLFVTLFVLFPLGLCAQATDCNDPHASPQANAAAQKSWENGTSPVYKDATSLATALNERGFHVQCMRGSVEERLFVGEKGAAWVKTDRGIFEVWFLSKPETFAALEVNEQQDNGRYLYTFSGTPKIPGTIDSSKQSYFIPSGSLLFHVWGDEQLAMGLKNAFQMP
jgi:hypothetical protein